MRRPMRWYWAATISFAGFHGAALIWLWLSLEGPLASMDLIIDRITPEPLKWCLATLWYELPPVMVCAALYAWLGHRRQEDGQYLHCPVCGYILKGLSEPRCPECGEPI